MLVGWFRCDKRASLEEWLVRAVASPYFYFVRGGRDCSLAIERGGVSKTDIKNLQKFLMLFYWFSISYDFYFLKKAVEDMRFSTRFESFKFMLNFPFICNI